MQLLVPVVPVGLVLLVLVVLALLLALPFPGSTLAPLVFSV